MSSPESPPLEGPSTAWQRGLRLAVWLLLTLALVSSLLLWQKLDNIQAQLARQSSEAGLSANQALVTARQAQDVAVDSAAKIALFEQRLAEVALQRSQIEELIQSLSRSRDENLLVDMESAVALAQQQAQLTGSVEPMVLALQAVDARLARAAQPRLARVQRAVAKDLARIKSMTLSDTPALLVKLDELALLIDDIPLANAAPLPPVQPEPVARSPAQVVVQWGERVLQAVHAEVKDLVRVSRINDPQAALLSPEQSFFVRENLKLRVLNARLGLLARQVDAVRSDLKLTASTIGRYFDPGARKTQTALALVKQMQTEFSAFEQPRVDETLAALSAAAAGH
jgi:uroporphyrin-3 C-methyltransferase